MPAAAEAVLPPRPTGRSYAAEPVPSGWRSWPVIVIIIATLAIIVAIVLMAWPAGRSEPDGKRGAPQPPAPERMQTDPEVHPSAPPKVIQPTPPPQGGAPRDPWGKVDPPPVDPDNGAAAQADDDPDVDSLLDPFATPAPPAGGGRPRLRINGRGLAMLAMAEHMCKKLVQCGVGDPAARSMCNGFSRRGAVPPPSCPAARRCLDRIDTMACGGPDDDLANLNGFMARFQDCADAIRC